MIHEIKDRRREVIPRRDVNRFGLVLLVMVGLACGSSVIPTPDGAAIARYLEVFKDVGIRVRNTTALMAQTVTVVANIPGGRADYAEVSNKIVEQLSTQKQRLEELEPVPQELEEAHNLMKTAIDSYVQAAYLFLPGAELEESGRFDTASFSMLMNTAGSNFHLAEAVAAEIN